LETALSQLVEHLKPHPKINQTAFSQPALFVIESAFVKLWMSWGIQPVAMIGHSIGEYVAVCPGYLL